MITFVANARTAHYTSDDVVTSGSVGIPVQFTLSEDYDELSPVAVFEGSGQKKDVALVDNECVVPHETVATAGGYLRIGVFARNGEGTIVIPTVWASACPILEGTVPSGVDPSQPTPDWTAQVQQIATDAIDIAQSVQNRADSGEFDGAQGPVGPQGATGPQGNPGPGVPTGGTSGQVLTKKSSTNYDTEWRDSPADAVRDVQINGSSILNNRVANIPNSGSNTKGVASFPSNGGLYVDLNGRVYTNRAVDSEIKLGVEEYKPIAPYRQHNAVFYGLAKAASDTSQAESSNPIGQYTENAKTAIRDMIGAGTYSKPQNGIPTSDIADSTLTSGKFSDELKLEAIKDYLTPMMYSGYYGDGVHDDSGAMSACITDCASTGKMLYIPKGKTVYIANRTLFSNTALVEINCYGKITAPNGVEFRRSSSLTGSRYYFNEVDGALILSGLENAIVTIVKATSLTLYADSNVSGAGSIAYNQFYLGLVPTLTLDGYNNGWINENVFMGGRINQLRIADNGGYGHNHNHFYNPTLEGDAVVSIERGYYNYIHNARFEGTYSVTFGAATRHNFVLRSWQSVQGPGETISMSVTDNSGRNYWTTAGKPYTREYFKQLDVNSYNYNTDIAYPLNGKLHVTSGWQILETKIIPISHVLNVVVTSETTFFRGYIEIFDQNGDKITTEPSANPIKNAFGLSWDSTKAHYGFKSANRSYQRFEACRYNGGTDTGVYYIRLCIYVPTNQSANITRLTCKITANYYSDEFTAFVPDRLIGTHAPAAGDWSDGNIVWNTGSTATCAGWYYTGGAWHEFGENAVDAEAIADTETATATAPHAIGDMFVMSRKLYKATAAIAIGDSIITSGAGANAVQTNVVEEIPTIPVTDVRVNGTSILQDGVANIPLPQTVTVSGTTPTIVGAADTRYICGEVATLDITLPASGIVDVVFSSGATATVLTITPPTGVTLKWANEFDPTSLEANTVYEVNILDGEFGVVGSWT